MKIQEFNRLSREAMQEKLLACCHCRAWAERVAVLAPFASAELLAEAVESSWAKVTETEILEAFAGHPQIGDLSALRSRFAKTAKAEQGQVTEASESVLLSLQAGNEAYREKFGFIFIVFASDKSAEEMLEILEHRTQNSREEELTNGAKEQALITRLRLSQLIDELN